MIVRSLDVDGDWNFGKGKADYLRDNVAIGQISSTRLKCFLGDCFFDIEDGIDWWTLLGSKNEIGLTLAIKNRLLSTPGASRLFALSKVLDDNRNLKLTYSLSTVFTAGEPITKTVGVP